MAKYHQVWVETTKKREPDGSWTVTISTGYYPEGIYQDPTVISLVTYSSEIEPQIYGQDYT